MALGNNPSQTDVIKAIRDLESGGSGGVQSVTTGSTNGTLSVDGTDVAVKGLGLNAFNSTTIPTSIDGLGGGTLTSRLVLTGGDAVSGVANIQLDTNGQITAKDTTSTLFGRSSANTLLCGHSSHALTLRGSATRPTYNGNNVALSSDIPSTTDFVTTNTEQTISAKKEISYGSSPTISKLVLGDKSISGNTLMDIAGISSSVGGYTGGFYVDNLYGLVLRSTNSSSNDIVPRIRVGTNYYTIATTNQIPTIDSSTITTALGYTPFHTLSYGGSSGSGSFSTTENTIVSFSATTSDRIVSISVNTYNTGSQAADIFIRYGSTSGTAYGGSTSVTAGTPDAQGAQMQMSTNSRHISKTLVFCVPKNTVAYVRGKGTTTLNYRYQYTTITIS